MVSVIMLTYNRKEYMMQMIQDILNQSYKNFEFIIIDNNSNDGSSFLIDQYSKKDNRIKAMHLKSTVSIGKGRNVGLFMASGEYVAYIDDDDRVESDYLEFLHNLVKEVNADIAMCGCDEFKGEIVTPQCVYNEKIELTGEEAVLLLLERTKIRAGMPTKLIRKELLLKYPFVENCKSEDAHTAYKYFANARKVIVHGIPNYHIRRHEKNNSSFTSDFSKLTQVLLKEYLGLYRERTNYLIDKFPGHEEYFKYTEFSFKLSMCDKIIENSLSDCGKELERMLMDLRENKDELIKSMYLKEEEREKLKKLIVIVESGRLVKEDNN